MLVLSRKSGEQLLIGDDIIVTVNRISGNRVAIGIEAPRNVRIVRGELEKAQVAKGAAAADSAPASKSAPIGSTNVAVASQPDC